MQHYLKTTKDYWQKNDFERAVGKLSAVLEGTDLRSEGQALNKKIFLMRAAAYRKLKQEQVAFEDERRAPEIKIVQLTRF